MLRAQSRTLPRQLTQPLGMDLFGASRIESDGTQVLELVDDAGKRTMTNDAGRLSCPGKNAEAGVGFGLEQAVESRRLPSRQAEPKLTGDMPLGVQHDCPDEALDDGCSWRDDAPSPEFSQQGLGNRCSARGCEGTVNLMIAGERKSRRGIEAAVRRQLRHQ